MAINELGKEPTLGSYGQLHPIQNISPRDGAHSMFGKVYLAFFFQTLCFFSKQEQKYKYAAAKGYSCTLQMSGC